MREGMHIEFNIVSRKDYSNWNLKLKSAGSLVLSNFLVIRIWVLISELFQMLKYYHGIPILKHNLEH